MRRMESLNPLTQPVPVVCRASYGTLQTLLQPSHAKEQQEQEDQEATYEGHDSGGVIHRGTVLKRFRPLPRPEFRIVQSLLWRSVTIALTTSTPNLLSYTCQDRSLAVPLWDS